MKDPFEEFQRADPFDEFQRAGPPTRAVLREAVQVKPDDYADAARLAKRYPAPVDTLYRNLSDIRVQEAVDQYDQTLQASPKLAEHLRRNPERAKIAHDDIPALAKIESNFAQVAASSVGQAVLGISEGIWRTPDALQRGAGYLASVVEMTGLPRYLNPIRGVQDAIRVFSEGRLPVGPKLFEGTTDVANRIGDVQEMLGEDTQTFGQTFADVNTLAKNADQALQTALKTGNVNQVAEVLTDANYWSAFIAQAAPSLYMALKSGGSIPFLAWLEGMEQASNAADFEQKTGVQISDREFVQAVGQTAFINALLERYGVDKILGAQGKGLSGIVKAAFAEGTTEGLQQVNSNLAALLAYNPEQSLSEGVLASIMGGAGSGGGAATARVGAAQVSEILAKRQQQEADAQKFGDTMKALTAAANESVLRERDPEAFREALSAMSGDAKLYIDGEVLNQLPPEVLRTLPEDVQQQAADAAESGGMVEIRVADALTVAPGTALEQVLAENARRDPFSLSQAEVKQAGEQAQTFLRQEAERVIQQAQDQEAMRASAEVVRTSIKTELDTVGRFSPQVNEAMSQWAGAFYTTMASRVGMTPEAFYQKYRLRILGQALPGAGDQLMGQLPRFNAVRDLDAWLAANTTREPDQINSRSGDDGVATITLAEGVTTTTYDGGMTGRQAVTRSTADVSLVFRLDDGRLVWWDNTTGTVNEVSSSDPRLKFKPGKEAAPAARREPVPTEVTVTVDGDEHSLLFSDDPAFLSDEVFDEELYVAGLDAPVEAAFRQDRGVRQQKASSPRTFEQAGIQPVLRKQVTDKQGATFDVTVTPQVFGFGNTKPNSLLVELRDPATGARRGFVDFAIREDGVLTGENVSVDKDFRQRDLAASMYQAARDAGYDIAPGRAQTDLGNKMVAGLQRRGIINREADGPRFSAGNFELMPLEQSAAGRELSPQSRDLLARLATVARDALANERRDGVVALQPQVDGSPADAQGLADLSVSQSGVAQEQGLGQRPALLAVLSEMRRAAANDLKVFGAIVGAVPVDVVNNLGLEQRAAENLLRNHPVFQDGATVNAQLAVAEGVDATDPGSLLLREVAVQAAELGSRAFRTGREPQELLGAVGAGQGDGLGHGGAFRQGPRATFNPQTLEIVLTSQSDLSSFFHEAGHFFLEVMADIASQPDAPAQIREDMDRVLAWFGITGNEAVGGEATSGALNQAPAPEGVLKGDDGKPLVLYHGTGSDIAGRFRVGDAKNGQVYGTGVYFSDQPESADGFAYGDAPNIVPAYALLKNPLTVEIRTPEFKAAFPDDETPAQTTARLQAAGHDGVVIRYPKRKGGYGREVVVFDPKQIVSAISGEVLGQGGPTPEAQPIQPRRTPLETWNAMTLDQKRMYHERWAESVEQYIMEGRAPSVELAPLMRRFAAWLKSVYGSIKQFLAGRGVATGEGSGALNQGAARPRTPEFRQWYAGSKVKGVVYHATPNAFDAFDTSTDRSDLGAHFGTREQADRIATGMRLDNREGTNIMPVWLSIKNPLRLKDVGSFHADGIAPQLEKKGLLPKGEGKRIVKEIDADWRQRKKYDPMMRQIIEAAGYDGVVYANTQEGAGDSWIAFRPEQIKSAIGNDGTFDANDPSILSQDPNAQPQQPNAIQLNDDIRRVMDRLLATDEQIAQAEQLAGMTPDVDGATGEALERLRARSMRDLKWAVNARDKVIAKLRKQAKTIEKTIRAEVTAAVDATPEMQAKAALDKVRKDTKAAPTDADLAVTADAFGFPSVDAMLRAIDEYGPRQVAIDGMTERRMLEEHGDLIDERAIAEAANEAVHNEARAKSLATELKAQADMLGARQPTGQQNAAGRPITVNALAEAARQFGERVVDATPLKDLKARAWQHTAAERRASKRWTEATTAGNTEEAVRAKQDQVLNNAAARAATDAQAEVRKIRDFFARVVKGNDETVVERGRDPDLVNAARAVLAAYGVQTPASKGAQAYLDALAKHDPETYNVVKPAVDQALEAAQPLDALTIGQLRALRDEIDSLWHLAKRSRQMEVDGDLMDIDDAAQDLFAKMEEIGIPDTIPGEEGALTRREMLARQWIQQAPALLRRVEQWAEAKDNKYGGPFLRFIFQPVKDAADRYRTARLDYRKRFQALVDSIAPTMRTELIEAPELGYTFGRGHNGIATAELLHAILHTGNDSNKRKLLLGRGWATELPDGTLDTGKWDGFIERMIREGKLERAHFDFAQGVWDLLEETKPLAQKTHRDVFGRYFAEVTANPVTNSLGTWRGGYVPAQADPTLVQDAELRELLETENASMSFAFPATARGFTKSRVEYNRPLKLDLRTLPQHIDKVLLFSHMEPAVRGVARLLRNNKVAQPLARIDPAAMGGMLKPWLNRAARQTVETPISADAGLNRMASTIRGRVGMALMFANVSNALQQITGFTTASVRVKPSNMMRAAAQFVANPRQFQRAVWDASPYMADRASNEVAVLSDTLEAILINPSVYERAEHWTRRHAYFLQTAFDNVMSPIIWTGAYNQAMAEGMVDRDAIRYADGIIRQTQGSTLPEDVSRIETGPAYARVFTQFMGYFNMLANTNATALQQIARETGLRKGAGRALYVLLIGLMSSLWVAEAIAIAMRGGPDDEDDDGYLDDWIASVFGFGTIKGILAGIPVVGQVAQSAVNRFNDQPADDKVSLSPSVSVLESAAGAPASVYKAIVDDASAQKAVRDVAALVTVTTGLPAMGLARPVGYLAGVADERIEPTSELDFVRGLITGTASPESKQ